MKRAFIIHGWDGFPQECWFPWLKQMLEKERIVVEIPQLPDASSPNIETWVPAINEVVGPVDEETYFIAHSTGCKAVLLYLQTLSSNARVGGVVLVGPWLTTLKTFEQEEPDDQAVARAWLEAPVDWKKVRRITKGTVGIISDNDPYGDLSDGELLKKKLGASVVIEHNMGHMGADVHCTELPAALEAIHSLLRQ